MLGLTERDFDAYLPDRASSNAYSRPRLEFKQRATQWARGVSARLKTLGISVDVHASDEHPSVWNSHRVDCQWVFFWRDAPTRVDLDALLEQKRQLAHRVNDPSPYFRHAFMALRLDASGVEVCVQLHPDAWIDFETLQARLRDPSRASQIASAIRELPEQFRFGSQNVEHISCPSITPDALLNVVNDCSCNARTLWIGWRVERAVAIEHAEILDEQLEDALVALAPAYLQVSWGPNDDPAGMLQKVEEMKAEHARLLADRKASEDRTKAELDLKRRELTEKSRERTRERVDYETPRARPSLATLFKSDTASEKTEPSSAAPLRADRQEKHERHDKADRSKKDQRESRHPHPRAKSPAHEDRRRRDQLSEQELEQGEEPRAERDSSRPVQAQQDDQRERTISYVETSDPIDKGSRVKVLRGAFAGKVGLVGEIDGKGARVLLGLLATRVPAEDLVAVSESKDRPSLQSSHQRRSPIGRSSK